MYIFFYLQLYYKIIKFNSIFFWCIQASYSLMLGIKLNATWPRYGSFADGFPRSPLTAIKTLRSNENLSFVLKKLIISEYCSCLLSETIWASFWTVAVHLGPIPPVVKNTSGSKLAFSTSLTLSPYKLIFSCSCFLYKPSKGKTTFEAANGWATRTSKNVRSNFELIPLAAISKI